MSGVRHPDGWRVELLTKSHNRKTFQSGQEQVDAWLKQSALQSQKKHLSSTKISVSDYVRSVVVGHAPRRDTAMESFGCATPASVRSKQCGV